MLQNEEWWTSLNKYTSWYKNYICNAVNFLESYIRNTCTNSNVPLQNPFNDNFVYIFYHSSKQGIQRWFQQPSIKCVRFNFVCVATPFEVQKARCCNPKYFYYFIINDQNCLKHRVLNVCIKTLKKFVGIVTTCLGKSCSTNSSFKKNLQPIDQLIVASNIIT